MILCLEAKKLSQKVKYMYAVQHWDLFFLKYNNNIVVIRMHLNSTKDFEPFFILMMNPFSSAFITNVKNPEKLSFNGKKW